MRYIILALFAVCLSATLQAQVVVKMKTEGGVSTIPCKVNGLALNFIFDTGASEVSMSLTEVSFMLKNGYLKKEDIVGTTNYQDANGNVNEGITIILKEIEIAGLKLKDVKASVVKNLKAPLLLGQSALRKLGSIQMDFDANTITIYPSSVKQKQIDTLDMSAPVADTTLFEFLSKDEEFFQSGLDKAVEKKFEDAISDFDMAISINPKKADYYIQRAVAKDNLNDKKGAIADYTLAISIEPKNSIAFGYRAESKVQVGDTSGALKDIQLALQFDTKNAYAYRERGRINYNRSKYSAAISDFTLALKYDPDNCFTHRLRGMAKFYVDNFAGAKLDFDSAISICDDDEVSWAMRGAAKYKLKAIRSALIDLDKAIELAPEYSTPYRYKGLILYDEDRLEEALVSLEKAVELNEDDFFSAIKINSIKQELKERIWISLGSSNDGDEWFMKTEMESKDYNTIRIWLKQTRKKYVHKKNGKSITYTNAVAMYLTAVDCKSKKLKFEYFSIYDSNGKVIFSDQDEYSDWQIAPPGSVGENIVTQVCERYNY